MIFARRMVNNRIVKKLRWQLISHCCQISGWFTSILKIIIIPYSFSEYDLYTNNWYRRTFTVLIFELLKLVIDNVN